MNNVIAVLSGPLNPTAERLLRRVGACIGGVELRLDRWSDVQLEMLPRTVARVRSYREFGRNVRLIFTWRSPAEGGDRTPRGGRVDVLRGILYNLVRPGDLLDVEYRTADRQEMLSLARCVGAVPVLSCHFLGADDHQLDRARRIAPALVAAARRHAGYAKLVVHEDREERFAALMAAVSRLDREPRRATVFSTGATSLVSRVAAVLLGMPLVYAGLERPVLASQPTVETLLRALAKTGLCVQRFRENVPAVRRCRGVRRPPELLDKYSDVFI